jgi:hypothetical protein
VLQLLRLGAWQGLDAKNTPSLRCLLLQLLPLAAW